MKGNVWLAGFIVFSLLAIGGAGFYAFKEFGAYRSNFDAWDTRTSKIKRLEKEIPTPTQDNEDDFRKGLEAYKGKVNALFGSLDQFQTPLDENLRQTEFPNRVKEKADDFRQSAGQKGVNISRLDREGPFFMGMEAYREVLPKQEVTPLLNFQLDAIDRILAHLVNSGIGDIIELNRDPLPGETDAAPDPSPAAPREVVQKFPVQFRFEGTHPGFQKFLNTLANDKDFFFVLRVLAVENSAPDGPGSADDPLKVQYIDQEGKTVPREIAEMELGGLIGDDLQARIENLGWTLIMQDAAILFGQETLKVFAVIDIVRFLPPEDSKENVDSGDSPAVSADRGSGTGNPKS